MMFKRLHYFAQEKVVVRLYKTHPTMTEVTEQLRLGKLTFGNIAKKLEGCRA